MPNAKRKMENTRGYTLIEILVALTIIGLIFSIGYVNFRDFSRRQALAGAARNIIGDLRLAQEQSLSGKKPSDIFCNEPNTLNGFNFRVTSTNSYVIEANCSGGVVETKSVTLPSDISVLAPSPNPITFRILGQGTNVNGTTTITLTQLGTSSTRAITVTSTGEIK